MSAHKPRRPRWLANPDTLVLARHGAARLTPAEIDQAAQAMRACAKALREGTATRLQWSILAGSLDVSLAIERLGVVRGLHEQLASADRALRAIHARATPGAAWLPPTLHYDELDAINAFVALYVFQVRQLARGELAQAIKSATGHIRSSGCSVSLVEMPNTRSAA